MTILDIGSGVCYFGLIARYYGMGYHAMDVCDDKVYDIACEIFHIDRTCNKVLQYTPISLPHRFDYIVSFMICFNRLESNEWSADEWKYFVPDVISMLKNDASKIILDFNKTPLGDFYTKDVESYFRSINSKIYEKRVDISNEKDSNL